MNAQPLSHQLSLRGLLQGAIGIGALMTPAACTTPSVVPPEAVAE